MKFRFFAAAFLVVAAFSLAGCTKLFDFLDDHPGENLCRIHRIITPGGKEGGIDTLRFYYNRDGNPDSVIRTAITGDFTDNWLFSYDNRGRLIQAYAAFGDYSISHGKITGRSDFMDRYTYDRSGRIIIDTVYRGAFLVDGQIASTHGGPTSIITLQYDSRGRVSREDFYELATPTNINQGFREYSYNAQGNWVRPGSPNWIYDNKINLNRTNKIWQFINRDYSVNNGFIADTYNSFGLPVVKSSIGSDHPFLFNPLPNCKIEYDCH